MPVRHSTSALSALLVAGVAILSVTAFGQAGRSSSGSGDMLVYFGTYTGEKSKGVYVSRLDLASGALSRPELAGETASPSFLAVHPSQNFLYAINEIGNFQGKASGSVSAFAIDRNTGRLTALNQQPSVGRGPAHLVVDKAGRNVLVANYGGGSVAVVPIGPDGALKPPSAFIQHTGAQRRTRSGRRDRTRTRLTWIPPIVSPTPPTSGSTRCWCIASTPTKDRSSRTTRRLPRWPPAPVHAISRFIPMAASHT